MCYDGFRTSLILLSCLMLMRLKRFLAGFCVRNVYSDYQACTVLFLVCLSQLTHDTWFYTWQLHRRQEIPTSWLYIWAVSHEQLQSIASQKIKRKCKMLDMDWLKNKLALIFTFAIDHNSPCNTALDYVSQNLSSVTNDNYCCKLLKYLLVIGSQHNGH